MMDNLKLVGIDEAARMIGISPRSLADKRYRARVGIPACKVGRRVVFQEADLKTLIERGRERLPGEGRQ